MTPRTTTLITLTGVFLACASLQASQADAEAFMKQMSQFEKAGAPANVLETASKIVALPDATTDQKFAAYGKLLDTCNGGWSTWTPQWKAYYINLKPEAEVEAMETNCLKYLAEMHKLRPKDADAGIEYGTYLAHLGRNPEAIKVLEPALELEKLSDYNKAMLYMRLSDASPGMSNKAQVSKFPEECDAPYWPTAINAIYKEVCVMPAALFLWMMGDLE